MCYQAGQTCTEPVAQRDEARRSLFKLKIQLIDFGVIYA